MLKAGLISKAPPWWQCPSSSYGRRMVLKDVMLVGQGKYVYLGQHKLRGFLVNGGSG
jgi:hypothetical protein